MPKKDAVDNDTDVKGVGGSNSDWRMGNQKIERDKEQIHYKISS